MDDLMRCGRVLVVVTGLVAALQAAPPLDEAEVRIPYGELKRLIEAGERKEEKKPVLPPSLGACRLSLSLDDDGPVIDAEFRTIRFSDDTTAVPLIGGEVALEEAPGETDRLILQDGMLCQVAETVGVSQVRLRLRPTVGEGEIGLDLRPCPATLLDTGGLPEGFAIAWVIGGEERIVEPGARVALPTDGGRVGLRLLEPKESEQRLRPPEPSNWSWQHLVLTAPAEDEIAFLVLSHASAANGSGVEAELRLPAEARGIEAVGDDLFESRAVRDPEGGYRLRLTWKSRDVLERDLEVRYRLPLRPLDEVWTLRAPEGVDEDSTRTRFVVPSRPDRNYAAPGLVGPLTEEGLPSAFAELLAGTPCFVLDGEAAAELSIRRLPVVATDDAVIEEAAWQLSLEPDGAMLTEGALTIHHATAQRIAFGAPEGMSLLACRVQGRAVDPIDLGEGRLEIPVPADSAAKGEASVVNLSFTGKAGAFDPLEGVMALALPSTPTFIRSLTWRIDLPQGYRADIDGNLTRLDSASGVQLVKKLCRDERPEIRLFYQSRNVTP